MKHIKLFKDPSLYDDFFNHEEIITPHIVVLKNEDNTPAKIKLQKYIPPVLPETPIVPEEPETPIVPEEPEQPIVPEGPASPFENEITLKTPDLGDTKGLGVTVYNYLKYKCGYGTVNASYTIPENEYLYCVYDSMPNPTITKETAVRVRYAVFDSYTIRDKVYNVINLYENNTSLSAPSDDPGELTLYFQLEEDGSMDYITSMA